MATKITIVIISFLLYSSTCLAVTVFDAARDCASRVTGTGVRYVPPCSAPSASLLPEVGDVLSQRSPFRDGLFKSALAYHFTCDSLRPLSIQFELHDGAKVVEQGNIAGVRAFKKLSNTVTHDYDSIRFSPVALNGAEGFQAIKPGCKLVVDGFVSYPEPKYFASAAVYRMQVDNLLALLLAIAQPDVNYVTAVNSIQTGIDMLQFLSLTGDFLTQAQIALTIESLSNSKAELSQSCNGSGGAQLCSRAIQNTRASLSANAESNAAMLQELNDYLLEEVRRLNAIATSDIDLRADIAVIQSTLDSIARQLNP